MLIDENKKQLGVVAINQAIQLAQSKGLDLVEVAHNANPPVCKIMDFGKFKYQAEKSSKTQHKTHKSKAIQLKLGTDEHDILVKANQALKWLKHGHKIKIEVMLRGREKTHQNLAYDKMQNFINSIKNIEPDIRIKKEQEIKKTPRGVQIIISK